MTSPRCCLTHRLLVRVNAAALLLFYAPLWTVLLLLCLWWFPHCRYLTWWLKMTWYILLLSSSRWDKHTASWLLISCSWHVNTVSKGLVLKEWLRPLSSPWGVIVSLSCFSEGVSSYWICFSMLSWALLIFTALILLCATLIVSNKMCLCWSSGGCFLNLLKNRSRLQLRLNNRWPRKFRLHYSCNLQFSQFFRLLVHPTLKLYDLLLLILQSSYIITFVSF